MSKRNEIYVETSRLLRFTEENTYELRSLFNKYERLVTEYKDGKAMHTGESLECSELDGYVETFMDYKRSKTHRLDAYKTVHNFLIDNTKPVV